MSSAPPPVFILSPLQRSGTNYLSRLIRLSPVFEVPRPAYEDRLLLHADLLKGYADATAASWSQWMDEDTNTTPEELSRRLLRGLGGGILGFLSELSTPGKRLLLKTPRSLNIDVFAGLFPGAKLLLLVRDGRDTVESYVRSFEGSKYGPSMRSWAAGARRILDFTGGARDGGAAWRLVKYEDLVTRPEELMNEIFEFLDEEPPSSAGSIEGVPVVGSSTHRGASETVHWEPLKKPENFKPVGRWAGWPPRLKRKFNKLAGRELVDLGYETNGSGWTSVRSSPE